VWCVVDPTLASPAPCLAGNAVLISPLTASFTFDGREQVADVLAAAFQVT
jgi:hypothetical protein